MADQRELEHWLEVEGFSKYSEALKLSIQDSKNDPETEPYKSKYASREILLDLKEKLESFTNNSGSETRLKSLKSVLEYELATNYIDTEEKGTGERYLKALQEKLDDFKLGSEFCSVMLKCYQQLGILWNGRGEFEKSLGYFSEAEKLYSEYKKTVETPPFDAQELFLTTKEVKPSEARDSIFENLHTHTLYYITQVYKNIGENKKSSMYCHKTLSRQLLTKLYDPVDWAVNCATLSQYHLTQEDYRSARHCLACASCVIAECPTSELKEPVDLDQESEDDRKIRERLPQAKANVALCWSKYCLDLLKNSAQKIEDDDAKIEDIPSTTDDEEEMLRFESLDVSQLESDVSCQIAKNYDEARVLFLSGQKHLKDAKEFYKLVGYVSNHVEIVQDHSQLFKYLTPFDSDMETQSKMYKRRVDMLVEVLTELNPQHYLLICRQLIFEIASVYGDMADLKIAIVQKNQPKQPSAHQIKKINTLLNNSAKYNTSFIDSMKQEGDLPTKYDESLLRVALLAHLCLARTHSKKICATKEQRIENLKKSLELYRYVVDYCNGDEEGAKSFEIELQACREMVDLLPLRLAKIAQEPDV